MPGNPIGGLYDFINTELDIQMWDGEIPSNNTDGTALNVDDLPLFTVEMTPRGFQIDYNFENTFTEEGEVIITVYAETREVAHTNLLSIWTKLNNINDWDNIAVGDNHSILKILLDSWTVVQEKGIRLSNSNLLYKGELRYTIGMSGRTSTRN